MIYHIHGNLIARNVEKVVIEAAGLGYEVNIPTSTFEKLPAVNMPVKLYLCESTGMYGSGTTLYGFFTAEEKKVFLLLKSISKIGAKGALEILSKVSKSFLLFNKAIRERDVKTLVGVFDLTRKTADKLILGLKDKIGQISGASPEKERADLQNIQEINDAVAGLMAMGFSQGKAREAVERAAQEKPDLQVADLIKHSLKLMRG
ncbi:MAG: Holliday junction branch migration protein RuvA [Elusimicrobia bacterium]|nr:Holliday junction branch migration protein RuvA [Elusimicrobiota bacterium]